MIATLAYQEQRVQIEWHDTVMTIQQAIEQQATNLGIDLGELHNLAATIGGVEQPLGEMLYNEDMVIIT